MALIRQRFLSFSPKISYMFMQYRASLVVPQQVILMIRFSGFKIAAVALTSCPYSRKDGEYPEDLPNLCFILLFTLGHEGTGKFSFRMGTLQSRMKCALCQQRRREQKLGRQPVVLAINIHGKIILIHYFLWCILVQTF